MLRGKLLFFLAFLLTAVQAAPVVIGGIVYETDEDTRTATVVEDILHRDLSGDIAIPSAINDEDTEYAVVAIGASAFAGCTELTGIELPESLEIIDLSAFTGCAALEKIDVAGENLSYSSDAGVLFDKEKKVLLLYPAAKTQTLYTVPAGVEEIGSSAFYGCVILNIINLPEELLEIGANAFGQCTALTKITSANPVPPVCASGVFDDVSPDSCIVCVPALSIDDYKVAAGWSAFAKTIVDGTKVVILKDCLLFVLDSSLQGMEITAYTDGFKGGAVDIPAEVVITDPAYPVIGVGDGAFLNCGAITSVNASYLRHIGESAFEGCSFLESVVLGPELVNIGVSAFSGCTALTKIVCINDTPPVCADDAFTGISGECKIYVPFGTSIDYKAADGWSVLADAIIDDDHTSVDGVNYQFYSDGTASAAGYTPDLPASVTFPVAVKGETGVEYRVTAIGSGAFSGCPQLAFMDIPAGITSIDISAFEGCISLQSFTVASDNTVYSAAGGVLFDKPGSALLLYPLAADSEYSVPETVQQIGESAFKGSALGTITLGKNIVSLDASAFEGCSSLSVITVLRATPPVCGTDVFFGVSTGCKVYVPVGAGAAYRSAGGWDFFGESIIEDDRMTVDGVVYRLYFDGTASVDAYELELPAAVVLQDSVIKRGITYTVTSIASGAFSHCMQMTSVVIGENVGSIGDSAFSGCSQMRNIVVANPDPPVCGEEVFDGIEADCMLYVPAGSLDAYKTADGWSVFGNNIIEGEKVTFEGVSYLLCADGTAKVVDYTAELPAVVLLPESVENGGSSYLVDSVINKAFFACGSLTSVTMGTNIIAVGNKVFSNCTQLETVVIGAGVKNMGSNIFRNCGSLADITIADPIPPVCEEDAFDGIASGCKVYVPAGKEAIYRESEGWSVFGSDIVEDKEVVKDGLKYQLCSDITAKISEYTSDLPESVQLPATVVGRSGCEYPVAIIGEGAFSDNSELSAIVLGENITTVESRAFSGCTQLSTINFPANVTVVKGSAFVGCPALQSFTVASGNTAYSAHDGVLFNKNKTVLVIYPNAKGTEYSVPDGVFQIGISAFEGCALTTAVVGKDVTTVNADAFKNCTSLQSLTLGSKITGLGNASFRGCSALTLIATLNTTPPVCDTDVFAGVPVSCKVYVPVGCSAAYKAAPGWNAFGDNIIDDDKVVLDGVNYQIYSDGTAKVISYTAEVPEALIIPATVNKREKPYTVTVIGEQAFSSCDRLVSVVIGSNVTSIEAAFQNCTALVSVTVSEKVTVIANASFLGCHSLQSFTVASGNTAYSAHDGVLFNKNKTVLVIYPNAKGTGYSVPDGVFQIGVSAFEGCALTTAVVGKDVTTVNADAFKNCTSLQSLTLGSKITGLGNASFRGCSALTLIATLNTTPPVCDTDVFAGVPVSCKVYVPVGCSAAYKAAPGWSAFGDNIIDDDKVVLDGVNYQIYSDGTAKVISYTADVPEALIIPATVNKREKPYTVTVVGGQAFSSCDRLVSVVIGSNVTTIEAAFQNCTALVSVTVSEKVTMIANASFLGCHSLQSFTVASGNTAYSAHDGVLFNKNKTVLVIYPNAKGTEYSVPDGVLQIGISAFEGCMGLTSVVMGKDVTTIQAKAFKGCGNLLSAVLSDKMTGLFTSAFSGCSSLVSVVSPGTTPPVCETGVFAGVPLACKGYVPVGRTNIYKAADGWSALNIIADDRITKQGVVYQLYADITAVVIGYTSDIPAQVVIPATITGNSGKPYRTIRIEKDAFANCGPVISIGLPPGIIMIGENAFGNCSKLQTANLSSTAIITIGEGAFKNCINLKTVDLSGTTIETIGNSTFSGCSSLTGIDISTSTVTEIGNYMFYACSSMASIALPASLKKIGYGTFASCGALTEINFPANLTSIGGAAFSTCNSLTSVDLSNTGVTSISDYAFLSCGQLSEVRLGDKVNSIGAGAFASCSVLQEIYSPSLLPPSCGSNVFDGVSKSACKLYVPKASVVNYKLADQWKDFFNIWIVSADEVPVVEGVKVYVRDGIIVLEGVKGNIPVAVYSASGMLIGTSVAVDGRVDMELPSRGVYLVKAGSETVKVKW